MSNLCEDITIIKELLTNNSSRMVEELKKIAEFKNHPETELLEFEVHDLCSFVLYPMTKEADQVFTADGKEKGYFVGHYVIPFDIRPIIRDHLRRILDESERSSYDELIKTIIEWFSDCWDEVKSKFSLPTYISLHDSHVLFDLSNKRWGKMYEQYS